MKVSIVKRVEMESLAMAKLVPSLYFLTTLRESEPKKSKEFQNGINEVNFHNLHAHLSHILYFPSLVSSTNNKKKVTVLNTALLNII